MKLPDGAIKPINSTDVIVSEHLPIYPDHREDARRTVRHGLRRWVEYIGEQVGPAPGEPTHHAVAFDPSGHGLAPTLVVSREMWADLLTHQRQQQRAETLRFDKWLRARLQ